MDLYRPIKVILYGGQNLINEKLIDELIKNKIFVTLSNTNILSDKHINEEITEFKPTHIIYNKEYIKYYDEHQYINYLIEPIILMNLCNKFDIHMTYICSGFIYKNNLIDIIDKYPQYKPDYFFTEKEEPNNFNSLYFISQSSFNKIIKFNSDIILNIRIKYPIFFDYNNKENIFYELYNNLEIIETYNSVLILNSFIPELVNWIMQYKVGTINCANPGNITKNDLINLYKKFIKINNEKDTFNEIGKEIDKFNEIDKYLTSFKYKFNIEDHDISSKLSLDKFKLWYNNIFPLKQEISNLLQNPDPNIELLEIPL